jgi:hypothetical protein
MLATGFALFGTSAWIEANRFALIDVPSNSDEVTLHTSVSSLKAEEEVSKEPEYTIVLPELQISGKRGRALRAHARYELPIATEPCSPWQDVGPERVADGSPIGERRVRTLCVAASTAPEAR